MTRLKRIENHGYKVYYHISGKGVIAVKAGLKKIKGKSITDMHKQIFGY